MTYLVDTLNCEVTGDEEFDRDKESAACKESVAGLYSATGEKSPVNESAINEE
jgi:hypothetical protein